MRLEKVIEIQVLNTKNHNVWGYFNLNRGGNIYTGDTENTSRGQLGAMRIQKLLEMMERDLVSVDRFED
tara:strand:- start:242 stop:448 length:207 start_codon:yes stop_codon:yes gene_type:complete